MSSNAFGVSRRSLSLSRPALSAFSTTLARASSAALAFRPAPGLPTDVWCRIHRLSSCLLLAVVQLAVWYTCREVLGICRDVGRVRREQHRLASDVALRTLEIPRVWATLGVARQLRNADPQLYY
jgi:hypothetical protein